MRAGDASVWSVAVSEASINGTRKSTGAEIVERGNRSRSDSNPNSPSAGSSALSQTRSSPMPIASTSSTASASVEPPSFRSSFTDRPAASS